MEATATIRTTQQRPSLLESAAIAVAISTVLNALGVFTEEAIHWLNLVIGFLIAAVAAAIVFGWFARRASRPGGRAWLTALVFATLALITVPAFWSGLPPVFAVAAIHLGRRSGGRAGVAAIVIGGIALIADIGAYATDIASRI
jgi:hypothetical protein